VRWRTTGNSVDGDFKVAWLLWPTTEIWDDGEIDFPECDLGDNIKGYSHDTVTDPSDNILAYQNGTYSSLDWHITTIEWTPTRVTFFIDGTQVAQTTNPAGIPTVPMRWVLQSETNLTSSHVPTDGSEADILIDWVAAWAYTP
jgi:beta-glucanase (GH16 family)